MRKVSRTTRKRRTHIKRSTHRRNSFINLM